MFRTKLRSATVAGALVLLVAACGSSKDQSKGSSSTTASTFTSSTAPSSSTTVSPAEAEVTLAGYRGISFGMTLAEASAAVGKPVTAEDASCGTATFDGLPSGIDLWWVDGKIVLAQVGAPATVADGRLRIGSTEAEVRQALGRDVAPQLSDDHTRTDLVYRTSDPATAADEMRFVITDSKVSEIDVGLRTYVDQQELCG